MSNKAILQFPNNIQYILTVPKALAQIMHWKRKDKIDFSLSGADIILTKCKDCECQSKYSKLQHPHKSQYLLTIPKTLVQVLSWKKSDEITFMLDEQGRLKLKKREAK